MVVKELRGRRRYILFRTTFVSKDKEGFIAFLRNASSRSGFPSPYVIQVKGDLVIIRCSPLERESVISFMKTIGAESILTSGTLKKLRVKYDL